MPLQRGPIFTSRACWSGGVGAVVPGRALPISASGTRRRMPSRTTHFQSVGSRSFPTSARSFQVFKMTLNAF